MDGTKNVGNSGKKHLTGGLSNRELLLVILVSVAVYFNALFNGFVFDDIPQIVKNPWIKDFRYIPNMFFDNVWGFIGETSNYYRPLMHVSYMLSYFVFGLNPWGFHFVNVILHVSVSVLVYLITRRLLKGPPTPATGRFGSPAFWAAVLFATHPIHTEVVTPIMGISDLSFTFFYLLSFYFYIRGGKRMGGSYIVSVLSFFVALLCKEPALTLPVILLVYDVTVEKEKMPPLGYIKKYGPYAAMAGIYMAMRFLSLGDFLAGRRHTEISSVEYLINTLPLFKQYLEKLIFPVNLNFLHAFRPIHALYEPKGVLSLGVALIFGASAWIAWKRNRLVFLGLLMIVFPLLPALYIPGLNQELENAFAERYLYLPSFGFVLLFALLIGFARKTGAKGTLPQVLYIGMGVLTVLYSIGTIDRNGVWRDNFVLFKDAVIKSPDSAYPHIYLGQALYSEKGDLDRAIEEYQIGLKLKPDNPDAHNKLGIVYLRKGWIDKAIEHQLAALKLNPDFALAHNNVGLAYFEKGWNDKAMEHFKMALEPNPKFVEAHNNLGLAYYRKGWVKEAMGHYKIALRLNPNFAKAHNNMGVAYGEAGSVDKAIWHFERAVRLDPDDANARRNLRKAYDAKRKASRYSLPALMEVPKQSR
jgi:tetratricopeptide (TPR) repeat protein